MATPGPGGAASGLATHVPAPVRFLYLCFPLAQHALTRRARTLCCARGPAPRPQTAAPRRCGGCFVSQPGRGPGAPGGRMGCAKVFVAARAARPGGSWPDRIARAQSNKRVPDAMDADRQYGAKRRRHDSGDDGSTTASTDEHHSDSDGPSRERFDDDAASLASIMLSIANSCGKRPSASQPSSAETVVKCMSASSSVTGDDDDHSGDSTLIKKQRRREKNRASAQQSRQRKKFHLEALEVRVDELERDRTALMAQVEALTAENKRLRGLNPAAAGADSDTAALVKAEELAGVGLLSQLAQAAQKLSAISA